MEFWGGRGGGMESLSVLVDEIWLASRGLLHENYYRIVADFMKQLHLYCS